MFGTSTLSAETAYKLDKILNESDRILVSEKWRVIFEEYEQLRQIIVNLAEPVANDAENLLMALKPIILNAKAEKMGSLDQTTIHDVIIKTKNLLTTPAVTDDNQVNPAFTKSTNEFAASMTNMKKKLRNNVLCGIGLFLLTAVIIAGTVTAAVFTLGIPVAPITVTAVVCALGAGSSFLSGFAGISFFKKAYHQNQITNKMENLAASLKN